MFIEEECADAAAEEDVEEEDKGSVGGSRGSKGKSKGNTAKASKVVGGDGKARRKATNGMKLCPVCMKTLPMISFPPGSGQGAPDK